MSEQAWNELERLWREPHKERRHEDERALDTQSASSGSSTHPSSTGPSMTDPGTADLDALVRRCRRGRLWFWLNFAVELAVVVGWLGYSWSLLTSGTAERALALGVVVLTLAGWGISLWNRNGQWRSLLHTPLDCARSEVERSKSLRRAVLLGWVLLLAVNAFMCAWNLVYFGKAGFFAALPTVALVTAVYVVALVLLGHRARRSLLASEALVDELSEE